MRIFDTFPFDGELALLEHRLAQTYELVDVFVLVEAAETYSGAPKELTFARHRARFAWAEPKLRVIQLQSLGPAPTPRQRAAFQRDAIRLGLRDAEPDDAVLLLDADEIVSPDLLRRLRAQGIDQPRRLRMTRHYEHAGALAPRSPCCPLPALPFQSATPYQRPGSWDALDDRWFSRSGVVAPFRALRERSAFDVRFGEIAAAPLDDAGRHFSSVEARLEEKIRRVFHTEWDGVRERRPVHLRRCRAHGVHHRGWWYAEQPDGPLPEDVGRLAERLPAAMPFPPLWRRRLVRTWAWVRLARAWPEGVVAAVDRHFESLLPLLALPLLAADALRAQAAIRMKPRPDIPSANS
jgi:beta-1,4-mannosyl-glycoprotein beta-1,4-N-acetylglucosaminyltransferase